MECIPLMSFANHCNYLLIGIVIGIILIANTISYFLQIVEFGLLEIKNG
jgi:hypothetical protein